MPRLAFLLAASGLLALGATPAAASHYQDMHQTVSYAPPRVYDFVSTLTIEEFERTRPPTRFRIGSHTHRVYWNNTVVGTTSTSLALSQARRAGLPSGIYADRRLTARERKRWREAIPLYDEADVMVLAASHPACKGMTRTQARGIVAGKITRWSQIVSGAAKDAISVRYRGRGTDADLRFGARYVRQRSGKYKVSYPRGSRGSADGGIGAAASGDHAVAAVTAWASFRPQPGVCAVPLDGVAPSDETVSGRSYPEAFRVTYVVPRRAYRSALLRKCDKLVQEFLKSDKAKSYLARRGLLVVGGAPAGSGPGQPTAVAPTTDHAGRAITTTPDAGAKQRLTGLRLESPATPDGHFRYLLEDNGTLRRLTLDPAGACLGESGGGWTIKGAWRYPEHGGGLIARLGWFMQEPDNEIIVDLPDAEPQIAYLDGVAHTIDPAAATSCSG